MRRRIGIYGATEEALQLIPLLLANPEVEIAGVFDPNPTALRKRLGSLAPETAEALRGRVQADAQDGQGKAYDESLRATPARLRWFPRGFPRRAGVRYQQDSSGGACQSFQGFQATSRTLPLLHLYPQSRARV